ncbi:MFS transporter [Maritalea sp. S77]|uniref:MFS transporter n=1 Tax=Maritalea sp. S77 TaxID=3415125 RepID=UPI003C7CF3EA
MSQMHLATPAQSHPFSPSLLFLLIGGTFITSTAQGFMLVGVPWLIVQMPGGTELLGAASFILNIVIFFSGPPLGAWMDRNNRKSSFVGIRFLAAGGLIIAGFLSLSPATLPAALVLTLTLVNFIVTFDQSARVAYAQSLLESRNFRTVNTIFELQNQGGNLIVGASLALVITHLSAPFILWALMGLFLLSGLLLFLLPATAAPTPNTHKPLLSALREAASYLKKRPRLTLISLVSFGPYICIQTGNFLVPVLLVKMLDGTIEDFALFEISFALGAIGVAISIKLANRLSPFSLMVISMLCFTLWYISQVIWPSMLTIIWLACLAGWGNSTIRIARNSWLMEEVPHQYMARVLSFFQTAMIAMKTIALGVAAWLATSYSPWHALAIVGAAQFAAMVLMMVVGYLKYKEGPKPL